MVKGSGCGFTSDASRGTSSHPRRPFKTDLHQFLSTSGARSCRSYGAQAGPPMRPSSQHHDQGLPMPDYCGPCCQDRCRHIPSRNFSLSLEHRMQAMSSRQPRRGTYWSSAATRCGSGGITSACPSHWALSSPLINKRQTALPSGLTRAPRAIRPEAVLFKYYSRRTALSFRLRREGQMETVQVLLSPSCAPRKMRNVSLCRAEKSELSLNEVMRWKVAG